MKHWFISGNMGTTCVVFCLCVAVFMTFANGNTLKSLERKVRTMDNYILDVSVFEWLFLY